MSTTCKEDIIIVAIVTNVYRGPNWVIRDETRAIILY